MRKILTYFITLMILAGLSACQNNGHIGWIFGVWRVNEYTVDGVRQDNELIKNTTFAFQNNIVQVVVFIDDHHTNIDYFGTWEQEGDQFTFNFTHHDDSVSQGEGGYAAPAWLGMTSDAPMVMHITRHSGDKFTAEWIDAEGRSKIYEFEKTW